MAILAPDSILQYHIRDICKLSEEECETIFNALQESVLSLSLLHCKGYTSRFTFIHEKKAKLIVEIQNVLHKESGWGCIYHMEDDYRKKIQKKIYEFLVEYCVCIK